MPAKEPVLPKPPQAPGANKEKVIDLLCQTLEAEAGGSKVYEAAIRSVQAEGLRTEWTRASARSRARARALKWALGELGVDPGSETAGREAVRQMLVFLAASIETSREDVSLSSAQLTAAGCVVLAETKADAGWRLISVLAKALTGERGKVLKAACQQAEAGLAPRGTAGWAHELWLQALGLPATLPPQVPVAPDASAEATARSPQDARLGMAHKD